MDEEIKPPYLLSFKDTEKYYGIAEWTLRAYAHRKIIPIKKIGRRVYIQRDEFEKWLKTDLRVV